MKLNVHPRAVETFGFLLRDELRGVGGGSSEIAGQPGMSPDEKAIAARAPEGWVAVLIVHGLAHNQPLRQVTVAVLGEPSCQADATRHVDTLAEGVLSAAAAAADGKARQFTWAITLAQRPNVMSLATPRRLGGSYRWSNLILESLGDPHEGEIEIGWGLLSPYRSYGIWASGEVHAPALELAQRQAALGAARACNFLSLLFRCAIQPVDTAPALIEGPRKNLDVFYARSVRRMTGTYLGEVEAYRQSYGPDIPGAEPHDLKLPRDAPQLWLAASALLSAGDQEIFWNAASAYNTAWKLYEEFPSLSFVSLVTAVEALIEPAQLLRCPECHRQRGIGRAFRETISTYSGVPASDLKKFTDAAYGYRSKTVHAGVLHGGDGLVGPTRFGEWGADPSALFAHQDWTGLEELAASTLVTWLRRRATGAAEA